MRALSALSVHHRAPACAPAPRPALRVAPAASSTRAASAAVAPLVITSSTSATHRPRRRWAWPGRCRRRRGCALRVARAAGRPGAACRSGGSNTSGVAGMPSVAPTRRASSQAWFMPRSARRSAASGTGSSSVGRSARRAARTASASRPARAGARSSAARNLNAATRPLHGKRVVDRGQAAREGRRLVQAGAAHRGAGVGHGDRADAGSAAAARHGVAGSRRRCAQRPQPRHTAHCVGQGRAGRRQRASAQYTARPHESTFDRSRSLALRPTHRRRTAATVARSTQSSMRASTRARRRAPSTHRGCTARWRGAWPSACR